MTPTEFKHAWEERYRSPLIVFPPSAFEGTRVSPWTRRFLSEAGLPDAPGPFLMIDQPGPGSLTTAAELWELPSEFESYWVIGIDGAGNPVVLCANDAVVYLNHDNDFEEWYINRDVSVLAEAALRWPGMRPTDAEQESFIGFLRQEDPKALEERSFWKYEIAAWSDLA